MGARQLSRAMAARPNECLREGGGVGSFATRGMARLSSFLILFASKISGVVSLELSLTRVAPASADDAALGSGRMAGRCTSRAATRYMSWSQFSRKQYACYFPNSRDNDDSVDELYSVVELLLCGDVSAHIGAAMPHALFRGPLATTRAHVLRRLDRLNTRCRREPARVLWQPLDGRSARASFLAAL